MFMNPEPRVLEGSPPVASRQHILSSIVVNELAYTGGTAEPNSRDKIYVPES